MRETRNFILLQFQLQSIYTNKAQYVYYLHDMTNSVAAVATKLKFYLLAQWSLIISPTILWTDNSDQSSRVIWVMWSRL